MGGRDTRDAIVQVWVGKNSTDRAKLEKEGELKELMNEQEGFSFQNFERENLPPFSVQKRSRLIKDYCNAFESLLYP